MIAVRKKLENKTEAVLMVSQELLSCQAERDSLKSQLEMWKERAEALQETLKSQSKVINIKFLIFRNKIINKFFNLTACIIHDNCCQNS